MPGKTKNTKTAEPTGEPTVRQIDDYFRPDAKNANRGTARGGWMIEESLRKHGAARSILLDADGNVIAGNKSLEGAVEIGIEEAIVVDSTGDRVIAVQRTDLDLDDNTTGARSLAVADNRAAEVNLRWDEDTLLGLSDAGADLEKFWTDDELKKVLQDATRELQVDGVETAVAEANEAAGTGEASVPTETAQAPYAPHVDTSYDGGIRMLQLFMTKAELTSVLQKLEALQGRYGTETNSDTVREVIRDACAALNL